MEVEEGTGRRFQWRLKRVRGEGFNGGRKRSGEKVSMDVEEGKGRRFQWRLKKVREESFNGG